MEYGVGEVREGPTEQDWGRECAMSARRYHWFQAEVSKCKGLGARACLRRVRGQCGRGSVSEWDAGAQVREAASSLLGGAQSSAMGRGFHVGWHGKPSGALGRPVSGLT